MGTDPWNIDALDLEGYLDRVDVVAKEPSRPALDELHEAHARTFTFDNIDVLLDQHPGVALDAVQDKFVGRGRGGYCFEHATLFATVLQQLGYDARRRLARVGGVTWSGRTHCVVEVSLDGERFLADPGFGMSITRPISLEDGAEQDDHGWHYQIRGADPRDVGIGWELHRLREKGWELMHTTDELPVQPVDLMMGHHFTSTYPSSHFRHGLTLTKHGAGRHTTVTHETVTIRRPDQPTEHRKLRDGELREWLHELGVRLTPDEESRLLEVVTRLRSRRGDGVARTRRGVTVKFGR